VRNRKHLWHNAPLKGDDLMPQSSTASNSVALNNWTGLTRALVSNRHFHAGCHAQLPLTGGHDGIGVRSGLTESV
jgi:hypothetical protein